jgi:DNA polymerase beta
MPNFKDKIIEILTILKKRDLVAKQYFKARAYNKVIDELRLHGAEIKSMEDIDSIPGVGEGIKKKIKVILETGGLAAAENAKEDMSSLDILMGVYGIGPVKAKELLAKGIKTIAQLRDESTKDDKLLNDKQKLGLQYYEDIIKRIPRKEMVKHERLLLGALGEEMSGVIVGSFRRGLESSGDIDMLITIDEKTDQKLAFGTFVCRLQKMGYIIEVLAEGDSKCLSIVKLKANTDARRLDLLVVPKEQFPFALLYFTGSGDFNVAFRKHALKLGYTLNEHGMKLTGKIPDAKAVPKMRFEAEIFAFLGLKYKEPNERVGATAVELLSEKIKARIKTRKNKM